MTREKAIELSIKRHVTIWGVVSVPTFFAECGASNSVPSDSVRAIRAHFRSVCHAYNVQDEPDYDGFSLRI